MAVLFDYFNEFRFCHWEPLRYCSNGLGAFHHTALRVVKTISTMHGAAVVPHNEVTRLPVVAMNELFLSEKVRQKGDGVLAF